MATAEFHIWQWGASDEVYRQAFERDGFVAIDVFSAIEVKVMRQMVHSLIVEPRSVHPRLRFFAVSEQAIPGIDDTNPRGVYKVVNTPLAGDKWFALIMEPRVLHVVRALLGPQINFHMGFVRLRPPRYHIHDGGWHRDFESDRHTSPGVLTALIYLDDMTIESGATRVLPGSQRDVLNVSTLETLPVAPPNPQQVLYVTARPGTVLFLDCLTVHNPSCNLTSQNRSIILQEYKTPDAVEVEENNAAFADLPLCRMGWIADAPSGLWGAV